MADPDLDAGQTDQPASGLDRPARNRSRSVAVPTAGVSPLFAINAGAVLFMTGTALAAGLSRTVPASSLAAWALTGAFFLVVGLIVQGRVQIRSHLTSLFAGISVGAITILHLVRNSASSLYPTSGSVDVVHHYALVQYLFYNGRLPRPSAGPNLAFLGEMAGYPFATHVNTAVLTGVLDIQPLVSMTLISYVLLALIATVLVELTRRATEMIWPEVGRAIATATGVIAALILLVAPRFGLGMLINDYFFAQVLGTYLLLFLILALAEHLDSHSLAPRVITGVASFLLALAYPLFGLIPLGAVGLVFLVRRNLNGSAFSILIPIVSGTAAGLLLLLPGRVSAGLAIIQNEGSLTTPTLALVGGSFVVLLMILGALWVTATVLRRRLALLDLLVATVVMIVFQVTAMYATETLTDLGSFYMANKLWYLFFLISLPFAGVGALAIARATPFSSVFKRPKSGLATLVIVTLMFTASVSFAPRLQASGPLITPDSYAVAEWARSQLGGQGNFGMAEGGVGGYMLYVGVLNQPRDSYAYEVLVPSGDLVDHWLALSDKPYLLTSDVDALTPAIKASGLEILHRQGSAAVLKR